MGSLARLRAGERPRSNPAAYGRLVGSSKTSSACLPPCLPLICRSTGPPHATHKLASWRESIAPISLNPISVFLERKWLTPPLRQGGMIGGEAFDVLQRAHPATKGTQTVACELCYCCEDEGVNSVAKSCVPIQGDSRWFQCPWSQHVAMLSMFPSGRPSRSTPEGR